MIWLNMAVSPKFSWPNQQIEIPFEGYRIMLQPRRLEADNSIELASTISVFDPEGITFEDGATVASRFLSRLAWSQNGGVSELFSGGSNNPQRPGWLGQGNYARSGYAQVEPWEFLYLPSATDRDADLALGLFREGMSVNSNPFAFLSYFKILNIKHAAGSGQKDWINQNIQHLWYSPAIERLEELEQSTTDIGKYLYEEGRCAVAHAYGNPLVNPDSYADKRRLESDLKLMKELAALFIEKELGVLSVGSYWEMLREISDAPLTELLRKKYQVDGQVIYVYEPQSV
jgi:hypothetical protein